MSEISDAELRRRLAFFPGVEVPPITPATKNLLINKLNRLEKQHGQKSGKKISSTNQQSAGTRGGSGSRGSSALIDYSSGADSADDAGGGGASTSSGVVRRRRTSWRNSTSGAGATSTHGAGTSSSSTRVTLRTKTTNGHSASSVNGNSSNGISEQRSSSGKGQGARFRAPPPRLPKLVNFSEDEEASQEDEEDGEEEDDLEDDDEEEEEDDEEDLEQLGDEEESMADLGVQTSPGLDSSSSLTSPALTPSPLPSDRGKGGGGSSGGFRSGGGGRFASSTPSSAPSVKNTASFLASTPTTSHQLNQPATSKPIGVSIGAPFSPNSPLRQRVTSNSKAFGSLGEVLASLNNRTSSKQGKTTSRAADITTQASPHHSNRSSGGAGVGSSGSRDSSMNSSSVNRWHSPRFVSKVTLAAATAFFLIVAYKYATLRPSTNIRERIPICGNADGGGYDQATSCVETGMVEDVARLFNGLTQVLESEATDRMCSGNSDSHDLEEAEVGLTVSQALSRLQEAQKAQQEDEAIDDVGIHSSSSALAASTDRSLVLTLLGLMEGHPEWGIKVTKPAHDTSFKPDEDSSAVQALVGGFGNFDLVRVELSPWPPSASVSWRCWLWVKSVQLWHLARAAVVYGLFAFILLALAYGGRRLLLWRRERNIRETQDVFELIEKVLSMLVAQSAMSRAGGKPFLAVNHIRDQLIPPQERKKKAKVWSKVVDYIRESESRVREDVRAIYGEEHSVWQWVPDIVHWPPPPPPGSTPSSSGAGPIPYMTPPPPATSMPNTPATSTQLHHLSFPSPGPSTKLMTSAGQQPGGGVAGGHLTPTMAGGQTWQGSAFNHLNRNVAAPVVAPTSCLKVRHMFPPNLPTSKPESPSSRGSSAVDWARDIKEEILRRASSPALPSPAIILHIAVDQGSQEGTVYIKAASSDEAGKLFRVLHGQWYRGQLVTVKYLREERYFERFPAARHQTVPLRLLPPPRILNPV